MRPRQTPGNMRERITLQRSYLVDNGLGLVPAYEDRETIWARVEPVKSADQVIGGGIKNIDDVLVHIRYRAELDTTWRIIWRGTTYGITGLRNLDERRQFLTLDATSTI